MNVLFNVLFLTRVSLSKFAIAMVAMASPNLFDAFH